MNKHNLRHSCTIKRPTMNSQRVFVNDPSLAEEIQTEVKCLLFPKTVDNQDDEVHQHHEETVYSLFLLDDQEIRANDFLTDVASSTGAYAGMIFQVEDDREIVGLRRNVGLKKCTVRRFA